MKKVWFVLRVSEGSISWDEAWNMEIPDFNWVYARCEEINQKNEELAEKARQGR